MSLVDLVLGEKPEPYDWRKDPRARPNPRERESLPVHVDECTLRQIEIKSMFAQTRIDRYHDRKVLYAIIAMLLAANAGGAQALLSVFFP